MAAELGTDLRALNLPGGRFDVEFKGNHFHIEFDRTPDDDRAPTREDPSILRDPNED